MKVKKAGKSGFRIKIFIQVEGGEEMTDRVLTGWKEIAEFMGWSERKAKMKKDELLQAGVIFYSRMGRPPRVNVQCFPSVIQDWTIKKSFKMEIL